jgi:hypothetical protein
MDESRGKNGSFIGASSGIQDSRNRGIGKTSSFSIIPNSPGIFPGTSDITERNEVVSVLCFCLITAAFRLQIKGTVGRVQDAK